MTSISLYTFIQGPTPTQWAGASNLGPAGAPFNCYPSPTSTIINTLEWIATGNGCPIGYGLSSSLYGTLATCLWTGGLATPVSFTWECIFTVGTNAVTTVNGGTTTVGNGNALTVTANPQTITVTSTAQQTTTATSVVAPGAATVSVTSTVTQNGPMVEKRQLQAAGSMAEQVPVLNDMCLGIDMGESYFNSSNSLMKRSCDVQCLNYCCEGRTCIGDGYHCCSTYSCADYDPNAAFYYGAPYLSLISVIDTSTTTDYQTVTTYQTVSIASGTVTITPTSTQQVTVTNMQTVSVMVTSSAGTVTLTVLTTFVVSSPPTNSPTSSPTSSPTTNPNTSPDTSPISISTSVPALVGGSVTFGPAVGTITHAPVPNWTGAGKLILGYCSTPDYILLTGPTTYWAPFVGCDQNKPDCCPFAVATGAVNYPVPQTTSQATLNQCPDDYQTVSSGCCPSGFLLWNTAIGGQVPCYSTLNTYLTPPPIPSILTTAIGQEKAAATSQALISPVDNIVYAMYYPANSPPSGLSVGAQAGIGAGVGVVGLALIVLAIFFLLRRRRGRRGPKDDHHYSNSTFQSTMTESNPPKMLQEPAVSYIPTQHQGIERVPDPYTNANPAIPLRGYIPPESLPIVHPNSYPSSRFTTGAPTQHHQPQPSTIPLGGYLPQEEHEQAPGPAYQNWPPVRDQHWQTAQGLQVSPPASTASPPLESRYGDGYPSPGSQTPLRPSELHAGNGSDFQPGSHSGETPELQGAQRVRWELEEHR